VAPAALAPAGLAGCCAAARPHIDTTIAPTAIILFTI
jgi:hypothetical protein